MNNATKTKTPRFAVLRSDVKGNGPFYQAREVGSVTRLRTQAWSTTNRAAADRMADREGGTVVPF